MAPEGVPKIIFSNEINELRLPNFEPKPKLALGVTGGGPV
jgi:hypothetical protein